MPGKTQVLTPTLELIGTNKWQGTTSWACLKSRVIPEMRSLIGMLYPGVPSCRCTRVRALYHPMGIKGIALLTGYYGTQNPSGRAVGTTRVILSTKGIAYKLRRSVDNAARTIEGPDLHQNGGKGDGIHEWHLTRGSNVKQYSTLLMKIQTAYAEGDFPLDAFANLYDTVNADTIRPFTWMRPGTVRFMGMSSAYSLGSDLVNTDVLLWWSPIPWNEFTRTIQGAWGVLETPVYRFTGGALLKTDDFPRQVRHFFAGYHRQADGTLVAVPDEPRVVFGTGNYNEISGMLARWRRHG